MYGRKTADYEGSINILSVIDWIRGKGRAKLRKSLQASRRAYRRALRYKEKPITEAELYAEMDETDNT